MSELTADSLEVLLFRLSPEKTAAGEEYEKLRRKIIKTLMWKGCPESQTESLADLILDRLALKISQGAEINHINRYALEILRFVWLEHLRKQREIAVGDDLLEIIVAPQFDLYEDADERLNFLRQCLWQASEFDRRLLLEYYSAQTEEKNKDHRKKMAEHFGFSINTLKVKVFRLREKLEKYVNRQILQQTESARNFQSPSEGIKR